MSRLKKAASDVLSKLEQDLKGEYEAINGYQQHIDSIDIPEIKNKLIEIMNEEKHHVDELKELIEKYK
jgi:rubrerythrin